MKIFWIFRLWNRNWSDPELVKDLLSLKPAGYLLKNLKPAEIKTYVDAFFTKSKK